VRGLSVVDWLSRYAAHSETQFDAARRERERADYAPSVVDAMAYVCCGLWVTPLPAALRPTLCPGHSPCSLGGRINRWIDYIYICHPAGVDPTPRPAAP
jgi:hypothetical protein